MAIADQRRAVDDWPLQLLVDERCADEWAARRFGHKAYLIKCGFIEVADDENTVLFSRKFVEWQEKFAERASSHYVHTGQV
jgi:hypothetical protein